MISITIFHMQLLIFSLEISVLLFDIMTVFTIKMKNRMKIHADAESIFLLIAIINSLKSCVI